MKPPVFEYIVAESPSHAVAALAQYDGNARVLAGGQSLVPLLNMRLVRPAAVVDINRIPGLDAITEAGDIVRIGALARYSALEWSPVVQRRLPLLAEAITFVGDRQVRNRGTLGGSLAQADPTGEMPVAALALDATIGVLGPGGARQIRAVDFFLGPYTSALESADVIVDVSFPAPAGMVGAIAEHARRHGDFAVVSVAATGRRAADGTWASLRVALGGVADRAILAERASALLTGSRLEADVVRRAGEACGEAADPSSDVRASADYRRHLIPIYLERVVDLLRTRATAGAGASDGARSARGTR
jgi:aerobic carbon-monoxide dehydrogenase medium subunit